MNQKHWLTRPETIHKLWIAFSTVLALTVIAGLFIDFHGHFGIESSIGFYAWFGFGSCVLMVVFAKLLGNFLLKRSDNYYE
ncbi:MAG: hypothetical protein OEX03_13150 [Gammaproteobacteria bacterium]|nr:hypothetical protein [Gammaproteobacteria bacterium]